MNKPVGKFALGTIIAAAVGYVAGILTAPKSGKETREDIKETAQSTIAEAEKRLKAVYGELTSHIDEAVEYANKVKGSAQKEAEPLVQNARRAKEKVGIALSSIHDGEVSDKDLKKAIDEAEKSLQYLRKFLQK